MFSVKIIIIVMFIIILISLGAALYYLVQDKGTTKRTVNALTVRITVSISIILLLIIGYYSGLIQPHGLGG
ncbi:MAG: twin transmembrane helix small protein [Pseudomonadota bacterium]